MLGISVAFLSFFLLSFLFCFSCYSRHLDFFRFLSLTFKIWNSNFSSKLGNNSNVQQRGGTHHGRPCIGIHAHGMVGPTAYFFLPLFLLFNFLKTGPKIWIFPAQNRRRIFHAKKNNAMLAGAEYVCGVGGWAGGAHPFVNGWFLM